MPVLIKSCNFDKIVDKILIIVCYSIGGLMNNIKQYKSKRLFSNNDIDLLISGAIDNMCMSSPRVSAINGRGL